MKYFSCAFSIFLLNTVLLSASIIEGDSQEAQNYESIVFDEEEKFNEAIEKGISSREKELIIHLQQSITNAEKGISKLNGDVLNINGMSSAKVRHFLNNLCSMPKTNYLEIGCWKGSTWCAALFNNNASISNALAMDNWSELIGGELEFYQNCRKFINDVPYQFFAVDCFRIIPETLFDEPVNIYFYDGNNQTISHEKAFTHFNNIFDDVFIAVVDDWNWDQVRQGTRSGFDKLNYQVLYETVLPARWNQDVENWWNGVFVAVIRKKAI